jgi:hypothetical protein
LKFCGKIITKIIFLIKHRKNCYVKSSNFFQIETIFLLPRVECCCINMKFAYESTLTRHLQDLGLHHTPRGLHYFIFLVNIYLFLITMLCWVARIQLVAAFNDRIVYDHLSKQDGITSNLSPAHPLIFNQVLKLCFHQLNPIYYNFSIKSPFYKNLSFFKIEINSIQSQW